ncbi:hypothetical protein FG382_22030 [Psychrobacillus lasiicapitis]|uniref:Transposon Tn7 transposition protein TnsD C-terminal domain-containing protein n=1 Tax=Psychrobacillus lasiicapitis TaxID=1636719 RepID=A0A544SS26_9BACI|nr:hypothetical protein FG382_22030 [Psychrobacillus lasiicapitis]
MTLGIVYIVILKRWSYIVRLIGIELPGVYVCPIHKELLWTSDVPFRNKPNKHRFFPLNQRCVENGQEVLIPKHLFQSLLFIAEQSYELLNSKFPFKNLENINQFYIAELNVKQYITPSKRIRIQELIPNFLRYFPIGLLKFLNSDFELFDEDTWFHKVLRKSKVTCHPLRHLLLLLFLGLKVPVQLQENNHDVHFFGKAPWPCLNKGSTHYKEFIIKDCIVTSGSKTGKPVGTFTCENCGFSYSRTGPDASEDDKYRIGRIKKFGAVWENRLHELYSSGKHSIRGISSELGVDLKTTKKYLNNKIENISSALNRDQQSILQEKRSRFIVIRKSYPSYSRTELRKSASGLYNWLYKNDNEWFISNLPSAKRGEIQRTMINWEKRDSEYLQLIIRETINLYLEIPLVRVTRTKIYQRLDIQTRFEKKIDKFPKCKGLLQVITETVEEFQIRRIKYFEKQYINNNIHYTVSSLKRAAGIKDFSNQLIRHVILDGISEGVYE